jgi:hypothetical protein
MNGLMCFRYLRSADSNTNQRTNQNQKRKRSEERVEAESGGEQNNESLSDETALEADVTPKRPRQSSWSGLWSSILQVFTLRAPPAPSLPIPDQQIIPAGTSDRLKRTISLSREKHTPANVRQLVRSCPRPVSLFCPQVFDDLLSPCGIRSVWEAKSGQDLSRPGTVGGYLIGPGDVYGGDYVIYPTDDPSTSHAVATISVVTNTVTPTVRPSLP